MNAGTFNNNPQENIVPPWLLPCTCGSQRCHYNARFKLDILYVRGLPYKNPMSNSINPNLTIQFIKFTYCNDKFSLETIENKKDKYQPLFNSIFILGWKVDPLIVITASARASTHIPSMTILEEIFKISAHSIENTFKNIYTIAIQHAMSILLHKIKLENNQPSPNMHDLP